MLNYNKENIINVNFFYAVKLVLKCLKFLYIIYFACVTFIIIYIYIYIYIR
jgi:hypothetical protein